MKFSRQWAMPNADTFSVPCIGDFVKSYMTGVSVDPFARNKRWATHTNDLNPNTEAEYHMDAVAFLEMLAGQGVKAGVVLLDPPYSPGQIKECYAIAGKSFGMTDAQNGALYSNVRSAAMKLCTIGTHVLSFGWNSCGMGPKFEQREIMLVAHGGAHNDTICLAEVMVSEQPNLF